MLYLFIFMSYNIDGEIYAEECFRNIKRNRKTWL